MMNQKEAVYASVTNTIECDDSGVYAPTKDQRKVINQILCEGFRAGKIEYKGGVAAMTDADLMEYVSGLQSNWLRKDKRLNGGIKYVAKNPGSRTGSTDATLKAMRQLKESLTDAEQIAEVQAAIDERIAELKPKVEQVLDVSALPEALRKFIK